MSDSMRTVKKPEERKAEMVEAAAKLFTMQGFVKTSVAEIVAAVDVAKGLFYYYFTTKDDMVKAVAEGWASHCEDVICRIADAPLTGHEKLTAVLDSEIWGRLKETPFFADLCLPQHAALYEDAVTRITDHVVPSLCRIVSQAAQEGEADVEYVECSVRVMLYGLAHLAQRGELTRPVSASLISHTLSLKTAL